MVAGVLHFFRGFWPAVYIAHFFTTGIEALLSGHHCVVDRKGGELLDLAADF